MQPERVVRIKNLLQEMAELGITRITLDFPYDYDVVEVWSVEGRERIDRKVEYVRITREEKEYYASEYDKCFGTTPRSDEQ